VTRRSVEATGPGAFVVFPSPRSVASSRYVVLVITHRDALTALQ
jgi:hypothetical protein